jgi:hypothetical protein
VHDVKKVLFVFVGIVALSACGGDDDPKPDASSGNNTAPVASFTINPTCTNSSSDQITFTSTSTDADGDTLSCSWVFNSGNPGTGNDCTVDGVTFPNVAPYDVTLTVDDGKGGTDTATMSIGPC